MEGPFVQDGGMGMNMGMGMEMAISPDMERWFEDYEWSTCWDFEASSWGPSKQQQQQQQPSWMMPQGQPAWMMPPGPPMGQQGGWGGFPDPSWSGGGGKGGPPGTLEGPYMGDANSGDQGDDWGGGFGGGWQGGGKGGGGKKGGSSDRGKGKGKQQEEEWGSSWNKQESWNKDGWKGEERGRKGAGKKGAEEEPRWKPEGKDRGGKKGEKGEKGGGKDGKSSGKDGKSAGKGEKGEKGRWAPKEEESKGWGRGEPAEAKWKPRDAVGGPEAREEKTNSRDDAAKDEVNAEIMTLVDASGSNLEKQDFDPRIRKFLIGLRNSGGRQKVKDALAMIQTYTAQKTRQSVKNWPAYLLTLLRKFEPDGEKGAKGKGKGRTNDREQEIEEAKPALKPSSKKAAAPVAASAGAAATQSGDGEVEVVRATQEVDVRPAPAADMPRLEMKLPPGWEDGRRELHEEISNSLLGSGQTADDLRNPFTSDSIDIEATLVSHVVTCLRSTASQPGGHHLVGLARSRAVQDCPRAAAAAALVGGNSELGALSDNASAMDAVAACTAAGASAAAATVLQEIALELTAEVLRNSQLGPVVAAA